MAVISTACWDTKDISDRAYIASLGIDKVSDESLGQENIPIKYKITAEIIKPSLLKVNSWQLDPEKKTTILISAEGETIQKALDLLQIQISRPLTLSHLQAVLVGERIADNFQDIRTFFGKHPEIARRLRLVFVKNHEAAEVLNTVPKLEHTVAHQLIGMIEISKDFSLSTFKPFTTFLSEMRANDGQALGGAINLSENQSLIRSGSAVFDKWKLVGWLNAEDTRKASLLMPKSQRNTFVGELKDGVYTYITDKNKVQIIPQLENGRLKFLVN
jgi:spore germination protein KC